MSKIVIPYHSGYGHTKGVAEAVAEGRGGAHRLGVALSTARRAAAPRACEPTAP